MTLRCILSSPNPILPCSQVSCEGPMGKTTLFDAPAGPGQFMRPDSELEPKVNPADIKNHMGY